MRSPDLDAHRRLLQQTMSTAREVDVPDTPSRGGAIVASSPSAAMRAARELLRMKPAS